MTFSIHPTRLPVLARLGLVAALCASLGSALAVDGQASRYYEDALGRYEKQDLPGAIIQLKNALQIDRTMLPVQVLLGKALLGNGEVAAAEVAFAEALRLGVNRAEIVVPLAQAYLAQGKHRQLLEQPMFAVAGLSPIAQVPLLVLRSSAASDLGDVRGALKSLEEARAIDPRSADPWVAEVPVRIRARQYREAADAVARAQALAPQAIEMHYQRGALAHVQGNLAGALAAYDQVVALDRKHVEGRVARAGVYVDEGRFADAARDLAELEVLLPKEPRAAYLRALLAERDGKPAVAKAALRQVTELIDPASPETVQYRPQLLLLNGLAHYALNEKEKAKPYLEALQRVQGATAASKLLAQIYLQESSLDRAVGVLEAYLRTQPSDGQAMTLLASVHMAQGRNARAISLMQEALRARDGAEFRTVLGMGLLRSGQVGIATTELEAAYRKDGTQTQAGVALAGLYLRSRQSAKAVAVAQDLVKRQPQNAGFHDLLGMALAQTSKIPEARAAFERAIALDAELLAPKLHLARVEIAQKQFDAAAERLAALLKADEKNVDVLLELSVLSTARGTPDDTLRWLERANANAARQDLRPGLALVDLHLRTGRAPQAMEAARNLNPRAPEDLQVLVTYARAQLANGDAVGARSTLNVATRTAGENAALQVQIATLHMAANNPDGAAYALEKALSTQPGYLPALAMAVDLDLRRGDLAKAEQQARQIAQQNPRLAIGHTLIGDAARARGQGTAAVEAYRRAHQAEPSTDSLLRLFRQQWLQDGGKTAPRLVEDWLRQHPQDARARRALADAYAASGQYASARNAYDLLLKTAPDDAAVLNNQANVLLRLKDAGAVAMAERAVAKAPASAQALDTLGWALFQTGGAAERDRALQLLRDARLREPGSADIRYHLSAVLAQTGRRMEAREEVSVALKSGLSAEYEPDAQRLATTLRE
ncbi:XrtA/PEP-CTERM system TPR-repeat protein PrsT [Pseudorhodoferax sp. Leaf267]|uniref:XrtA/PEP-CTERM system TPR-repeat protein PrsT n=1 Tax=Pseudorhodoferax sp. Leaf267 TaxID=1736316 RepID=UPI000B19B53D|nr:XrtA/PEP-CTERM system TPR-repeat protein PrsT [Pseudorhodoferax sp. Leaf267]